MSRITVFGGTGFVGRHIVRHLCESGTTVRIASRQPRRPEGANVEQIAADAHDERSVDAAVEGADGVVNAISLYVEHGSDTFHSVHVEAAARIARAARRVGTKRLVHLSGIGADAASPSPYIRSRGEGEAAVQAAFPGAIIVRPAVMFAPDDGFLTTILRLLRARLYSRYGPLDCSTALGGLCRKASTRPVSQTGRLPATRSNRLLSGR